MSLYCRRRSREAHSARTRPRSIPCLREGRGHSFPRCAWLCRACLPSFSSASIRQAERVGPESDRFLLFRPDGATGRCQLGGARLPASLRSLRQWEYRRTRFAVNRESSESRDRSNDSSGTGPGEDRYRESLYCLGYHVRFVDLALGQESIMRSGRGGHLRLCILPAFVEYFTSFQRVSFDGVHLVLPE